MLNDNADVLKYAYENGYLVKNKRVKAHLILISSENINCL